MERRAAAVAGRAATAEAVDHAAYVVNSDGGHIRWNSRFVALRGHYAFHATACTPGGRGMTTTAVVLRPSAPSIEMFTPAARDALRH